MKIASQDEEISTFIAGGVVLFYMFHRKLFADTRSCAATHRSTRGPLIGGLRCVPQPPTSIRQNDIVALNTQRLGYPSLHIRKSVLWHWAEVACQAKLVSREVGTINLRLLSF